MTGSSPLDLWGGVECTVARRGGGFRDQVAETGHRDREGDLDRIAALGIRTLRYPVIWETVAPDRPGSSDFRWHDARLARLRLLGIRPILGLVHHGSGPRYTDLLDRDFPRLLARHAARVARRYPWVTDFTPVNEPLTTARFSCLYGHWYPHARDYRSFLAALVAQCRATLLAMRAIRRVTPAARLVQTEDFGRVSATPALRYQAEHENERRWLTFDLLFGQVDRHHPWWRILRDHGISARDLDGFRDGEGRPDILGINHYLTSERFLDERLDRYPAHLAGGNGRDGYADVEAVRVPTGPGELGPAARLREVWQRYRAPVAVTEAHHGCTRDEQLRWLAEVWRAAKTVRREGADIRAVTAWSLFGTVDWNSLLTRDDGIYEPGAFDIRGPEPRPTALARAVSDLARTGRFAHPVLDSPGWWRRGGRFYAQEDTEPSASGSPRAILVAGPDSPLRRAVLRVAERRGLACMLDATRSRPEIVTAASTSGVMLRSGRQPASRSTHDGGVCIGTARPVGLLRITRLPSAIWAVLDLSAAGSSEHPDEELAAACGRAGLPYVLLSGAACFGDRLSRPATEEDVPCPEDEAGLAALRCERRVLEHCPAALAVRTGELFGPWEPDPLLSALLRALAGGDAAPPETGIVSPTYLPDLAHVVLDLLIDGDTGVRHLASGSCSVAALAGMLAARLGLPAPAPSLEGAAPGLALATARGELMPPLASALDRYVVERTFELRPESFRIAAE